jgi:hypothetical protein
MKQSQPLSGINSNREGHYLFLHRGLLYFIIVLLIQCAGIMAQNSDDKMKIVENASELPQHVYRVNGSLKDLLVSQQDFRLLMNEVKNDIEADLRVYQINDKAENRRLLALLSSIYLLTGKDDLVMPTLSRIREMQTNEVERQISGIPMEAVLAAQRVSESDTERYLESYRHELLNLLRNLPYPMMTEKIKEMRRDTDIYTKNIVFAIVDQSLQPLVPASGEIGSDIAQQLVTIHYLLNITIPLNDISREVYQTILNNNKDNQPKESCAFMNINLPADSSGKPVVVAIWDTGIDYDLFEGKLFVNKKEKLDGVDEDKNGYVDDIHGLAFNINSQPTEGNLLSLADLKCGFEEARNRAQGMSDITAGIESPQAKNIKELYKHLTPEEFQSFQEDMTLFGIYYHGTGVADIAASGNPFIRLLMIRNSYDHHRVRSCPSINEAINEANMMRRAIEYMKSQQVRIVNMSWGQSYSMVEKDLEQNKVGESDQQRRALAREIFQIIRDTLFYAIKESPEILFITGSTNSGNDASFDEMIPSSYNLPNLLVVGAGDKYGRIASFSGEKS